MASINKGDNTGAFGHDFLRIYINNPNNLYIQKALLQINGNLEKEFYEPTFPLRVNFTGEETNYLCQVNTCKLALWDEYGRRRTADGKFTFYMKENRINSPDEPTNDEIPEVPEDNSVHFNLDDAEFAAQFVIDAVPTKLSELQQDMPYLLPENILAGKNITIETEGENVTINADLTYDLSYNELEDLPRINGQVLQGDVTISAEQINADWNATSGKALILNKPKFANVAFTGNYTDIISKPKIPSKLSELKDDIGILSDVKLDNYYTKPEVDALVDREINLQPIYDRIDEVSAQEVKDISSVNETLLKKADKAELENVKLGLEGQDRYLGSEINVVKEDITTIKEQIETLALKSELLELDEKVGLCATKAELKSAIQPLVNTTEFEKALSTKADKSEIGNGKLIIYTNGKNVGEFTANSFENKDIDLRIPTKYSDLIDDKQYLTVEELEAKDYATTGELYLGLNKKADVNSVGMGILTIQRNGVNIAAFNANATSNKVANISVPTNLSDLEQDIEYLKDENLIPLRSELNALNNEMGSYVQKFNQFQSDLDNKVDRKAGYDLQSITEINRLADVYNYDDSELRALLKATDDKVNNFDLDISGKVDIEEGKQLSTNDYTDADKDLLASLAETVEGMKSSVDNNETNNEQLNVDVSGLQQQLNTVQQGLSDEGEAREEGDLALQKQIEALEAKANVVDILGTIEELDTYDRSKLIVNDVICILCDSTNNDTVTYYRWNGTDFDYIGSEGSYYTKSESDSKYVQLTTTVNGHELKGEVELTAEDVHALSEDTVIGNGRLTIQVNSEEVATFDANQSDNQAVDLTIPVDIADLENREGFVNKETMYKDYLGSEFPEDTVVKDELDSLKALIDKNSAMIEALNGNLPDVALTGQYSDLLGLPQVISDIKKNNKANPDSTDYIDNVFIRELKEKTGYLTEYDLGDQYAIHDEIPTKVSELDNDRGYLTATSIGHGILTFKLQDAEIGTWESNSKDNVEIVIPVDTALSTESINPVQNKIITTQLNLKADDAATVHRTGNEDVEGTKTINDLLSTTQEKTDSSKHVATTEFVKIQDYAVNPNVVHLTGDEEIQGDKTFAETTTFVGITNLGSYAHVATPTSTDNDLVVNIEYVTNKNNELKTALTDLITANTTLIQGHDSRISSLETTIAELQATIASQTELITQLQSDLTELTERVTTLEGGEA